MWHRCPRPGSLYGRKRFRSGHDVHVHIPIATGGDVQSVHVPTGVGAHVHTGGHVRMERTEMVILYTYLPDWKWRKHKEYKACTFQDSQMFLRTSCCIIKHYNITLIMGKQIMLQEHHCNHMTDANFQKVTSAQTVQCQDQWSHDS